MKLHELEIGRRAPARYAIATPSPVATGGLVVSLNTWPAPPVASSVRARATVRRCRRRRQARAPHGGRRLTITSSTRARDRARDAGGRDARRQSTRPISRPVASRACSTRRTLCAPSRPSAASPSASRSNARAPLDQLADVARPFLDQHAHRALVAQAVAGGDRVGRVQLRRIVGADRGGDAALRVAGVALARLGLGEDEHAPAPASSTAARRPAMPLPMMRKSARRSHWSDPVILPSRAPDTARSPGHSAPTVHPVRRRAFTCITFLASSSRVSAPIRSRSAAGVGHARRCSTPRRRSAGSSSRARRCGGCTGGASALADRRRADPASRRRALQEQLPTVGRIYDALIRAAPIARDDRSSPSAAA